MKVVYSDAHRAHRGGREIHRGELMPIHEIPERLDPVLARLRATRCGEMVVPRRHDDAPLHAVHRPDYVRFLAGAWDAWHAEEPDQPCALAWVFPGPRPRATPPAGIHGKLGYYAFDLSAPIVAGTWLAARTAADIALSAQELVSAGERAAFALCRPPGHHAGIALAGGYCYLNNAAIAAQAFRDHGAARVAVLDVDYHHGNGTQAIFYARADVLYVSLHADPDDEFPFYHGYTDETGAGEGEGSNLNLPLAAGTGWSRYGEALAHGIERIRAFAPEALVVSLGVDTFAGDPISRFTLVHDDFVRIGAAIAGLGLPTLFVMEGGYAVDAIGVNTVNVLLGFEQAG